MFNGTAGQKLGEESPFLYDLRFSETADECYFTRVAAFSDEVLAQAENHVGSILDSYLVYRQDVLREIPASRGEAALELLSVGTAIELYWHLARHVPRWMLKELQKLIWRHDRPSVTINMLRDALFKTFMRADCACEEEVTRGTQGATLVAEQLSHLITWLQCTVDLGEMSRCLINWSSVLRSLPAEDALKWGESIRELFEWFERRADEALGKYTRGVDRFLARRRKAEDSRLDKFLRAKKPVAYHLAMVSAEIGNRGIRGSFRRCAHKVVLLPACMRGVNARTCPGGQSFGLDVTCSACDGGCGVQRTTATMRDVGVDVHVENCPRTSARWTSRWSHESRNGIVVVACLANLRSIQLSSRAAGMICQVMPLDFPGCHAHWCRARTPTTLNQSELVRLVKAQPPAPTWTAQRVVDDGAPPNRPGIASGTRPRPNESPRILPHT